MSSVSASARLIDELVSAVYGTPDAAHDARARHGLTQALHALARLSRSEQLLEIKRDAARAAGAGSRREMRTVLRRIALHAATGQCQLSLELSAGDGVSS